MEEFITLNKSGVLKIGIKDYEGNPTGEYLEFDMEDIELPIIINNSDIEHKKNLFQDLKRRLMFITKQVIRPYAPLLWILPMIRKRIM